MLVGGSALYVRAILDAFEFPATDVAVRARWEAELERVGPEALHARLAEVDPEAAGRMEPVNGRRTVRALEVIEITGQPFSASLPQLTYRDPRTLQVGVEIDRPTLDARIEQRVHEMYDDGLVAEVERLLDEGLAQGRTASRAIGYAQAAAHLAGDLTLEEARLRTVFATRRFARRQMGWWTKDPRIVWVPHDAPDRVERTLAALGPWRADPVVRARRPVRPSVRRGSSVDPGVELARAASSSTGGPSSPAAHARIRSRLGAKDLEVPHQDRVAAQLAPRLPCCRRSRLPVPRDAAARRQLGERSPPRVVEPDDQVGPIEHTSRHVP